MSNSLWGVVIPYWHLAGMIGWLTAGLAELADRARVDVVGSRTLASLCRLVSGDDHQKSGSVQIGVW